MSRSSTLSALCIILAALLLTAPVRTAKAVWIEDVDTDIYPPSPTFSEYGDADDGPEYWNKYTEAGLEDNYYGDGWYFDHGCYATVMVQASNGGSESLDPWLESGIEVDRMWEWTGGGMSSGNFHYGCFMESSLWVQGEADSDPCGTAECLVYSYSDGAYGSEAAYYLATGEVENDTYGETDYYVYGNPTLYTQGVPYPAWEFFRVNQRWELEVEDGFSMSGLNVVYMDFATNADVVPSVAATAPVGGQARAEATTCEAGVQGEIWAYID